LNQNYFNKIYNGDAEQILKQIPDRSVHLIVTSPPYNVDINYDTHNDTMDMKDYFDKMEKILKEFYRILVRGGRIAINLPSAIAQHNKSHVAYLAIDWLLLMRKVGFIDRELITWIKNISSKVGNHWAILPTGKSTSWASWMSPSCPALRDASEFIIVMYKESPKLEGDKSKIDITREEFLAITTNAWLMFPNTTDRKEHPAPFPKELPRRLIKLYTYIDNVILDPFCGIGTTCLVAKELKRKYIGIDVSEKYCKITREKLKQQLFDF